MWATARADSRRRDAGRRLSFVRPRRRLSSAPTVDFVRRRAQKLSRSAVAPPGRHTPTFLGRALTASSTAACLIGSGGWRSRNLRRSWGSVCLILPTKHLAECFCVLAAALRSLSAGGAIEVRSTASEPARKKPDATDKGKLGDAIRQLRAVASCMPPEIAVIGPEGDA